MHNLLWHIRSDSALPVLTRHYDSQCRMRNMHTCIKKPPADRMLVSLLIETPSANAELACSLSLPSHHYSDNSLDVIVACDIPERRSLLLHHSSFNSCRPPTLKQQLSNLHSSFKQMRARYTPPQSRSLSRQSSLGGF